MKNNHILSLIFLGSLAISPATLTAQEAKSPEHVSLFDGKTLTGWKTVNPDLAKHWSVVDGVITGSNGDQKIPKNTFLATEKEFQDFEFTCEFRLSGDHATGLINSGIQYRSVINKKIIGYQADIGKGYWGDIYDEHRRGKLVQGNTTELFKNFKEDDWHTYKIICKGDDHKTYINGHLVAEYTEKNPEIPKKGVIAIQLHSGGVAKIEFKNIQIKELSVE